MVRKLQLKNCFNFKTSIEYAMNSLYQSLQKLNDNLSNDFDKSKTLYEQAKTNHCSEHTKNQLFTKGLK
jgi:hypothetical protein